MDQKRLNQLLAQVIAQAEAIRIPVSKNIDPVVRVNRRAQKRFGCCIQKDGAHHMELSGHMLEAEEFAICQVLAHEVLHTCRGCANHGERWKGYARRMNAAYGYEITRTDTFEKLGLVDSRPVKYVVVCQRCGQRFSRMKRSPLVDHPERYHCRCGGALRVESV